MEEVNRRLGVIEDALVTNDTEHEELKKDIGSLRTDYSTHYATDGLKWEFIERSLNLVGARVSQIRKWLLIGGGVIAGLTLRGDIIKWVMGIAKAAGLGEG